MKMSMSLLSIAVYQYPKPSGGAYGGVLNLFMHHTLTPRPGPRWYLEVAEFSRSAGEPHLVDPASECLFPWMRWRRGPDLQRAAHASAGPIGEIRATRHDLAIHV